MIEYLKLFSSVENEKAIGEASISYLHNEISAMRIKKCIPNAKLIVSLRNPIDRAYSNYLMSLRSKKETRPFTQVFREKAAKGELLMYYENLKRYFDLFDKSQIKIVFFRDLKKDAIGVTKELFRFLEVDDEFVPDVSFKYNPGGMPKNKFLHSILRKRKRPIKFFECVRKYMPEPTHLFLIALRAKNLKKIPPLPVHIRKELIGFFREDILKLQDFINVDLSDWLNPDVIE